MLKVNNLTVSFGQLQAVRGISFSIERGEAVGIVGESGCGKSTIAQAIMGLTPGQVGGEILFEGVANCQPGKKIGMIFQDPMTFLNPTMKIGSQIAEGMIYHKLATPKEAHQKAIELLTLVGVPEPHIRVNQYPHHLSGGMRQRVLIAIALACNPLLLIADEPTTALDPPLQRQILALIQQMIAYFQMSLLLISHNFEVIASICQTVLVMYAGKIVERGPMKEVLQNPQHPYTQMLIKAKPRMDQPKNEPLYTIEGSPPHLLIPPSGCPFQQRCPLAIAKCKEEPPGPVACWRCHD